MRSKRTSSLLFLVATLNGCGLLGTAENPDDLAKAAGEGCLNEVGSITARYTDGDVTEEEWKKSWDCVNQSLGFFTQYVRGSENDAYTASDMHRFASKFLVTNKVISKDLIRGGFFLKSSLLGGTNQSFTYEEVQRLKDLITQMRDITAELIPYFKLIRTNPSEQARWETGAAIERAADKIAAVIASLPVNEITSTELTLFLTELVKTLDLKDLERISDQLFLAKWMITNTRPDKIEKGDWPKMISILGRAGNLLFVYLKTPKGEFMNDYIYREFLLELAKRARPILDEALAHHNGVIPFPLIDKAIAEIPSSVLDVPSALLSKSLKPVFRKILGSSTEIGLDQGVIDNLYGFLISTTNTLGFIDRVYQAADLNPNNATKQQVAAAFQAYSTSVPPGRVQAFREASDAFLKYRPLFHNGTNSILFHPSVNYSKFQGQYFSIIRGLGRLVLAGYAPGKSEFVADDFRNIVKDYIDLLFRLKVIDPTVVDFAGKRFQDMDLFMPASNGDGKVSLDELTYYSAIVVSAGEMSKQLKQEIVPVCDAGLGQDILDWTIVPAGCFRHQFFSRMNEWTKNMPLLNEFWNDSTPEDRNKMMVWIEHGGRRNGYNQDDVGSFDFRALPTVLHYVESLYSTYDVNQSNILGRTEILNAFPLFRGILAKKANQNDDFMLKGIFTYIVKYRTEPDTKTAKGIFHFLGWLMKYAVSTTKLSTDRNGVYNIVCLLASPESASQQAKTAEICKLQ